MPYIQLVARPALDPMIDGLIKILKPFGIGAREEVRQAIANLVVYTQVADANHDQVYEDLDSDILCIGHDLGLRLLSIRCVRGDLNYCVTRIVLETLRPRAGWSYHSLSDAVSVCNLAADKVIEIYGVDEEGAQNAISIFRDVADEIKRRLLGPYEDKAILKNGDMQCFAGEDFAYIPPLDLPKCTGGMSVAKPFTVVGPERREVETIGPEDFGKLDLNMLALADAVSDSRDPDDPGRIADEAQVTPLPPIRDALTQQQFDTIDEERRADEG
jgi:hypothetical protein